ncbi:MAG: DUF2950 domain-containing protein [Betaproteobacteria bacterium]
MNSSREKKQAAASTRTAPGMALKSRAMLSGLVAGAIAVAIGASLTAGSAHAEKIAQKTFATPDEAVTAMVDAVKANDAVRLREILGPGGGKLVNSGDSVADAQRRKEFAASFEAANKLRLDGDSRAVVLVGKDEWPMPIPVVKSAGSWHFDTKQGSEEILKRRIGQNELATMEVCRAVVDAQREYVAKDQDKNGLLEYATKFISTPGNRDGLYWEASGNDAPSPLGPLIAAAARDGYGDGRARPASLPLDPYHGYYYRILTRQGKDAPGGAYDYVVRGKMIGGFAIIAYPARYRASGITSFIVNHDGVVYEKDLGRNTTAIAEKMASFDPDSSWKRP